MVGTHARRGVVVTAQVGGSAADGSGPHPTGTSARDEILARIRRALGPDPTIEPVPRTYRAADEAAPPPGGLLGILAERLEDYRARVFRTAPDDLARTVISAIAEGAGTGAPTRIGVPRGIPSTWLGTDEASGPVFVVDDALSTDDLDRLDGVVTGAALAIAETGTIVLDGSAHCGRRALTLVPDLHVCVVTADQVVAGVPEGIARLEATRPQTWISGPSATSDIELDRVEGVHGPRTLHVVLVGQ